MVDFLVAAMQGLCIFGLLCGAYLSITYSVGEELVKTPERFDPVTTHTYFVGHEESRRVRA